MIRTSQHLPFVMNEIFDRPHLVSAGTAKMIAAALSGRIGINALVDDFGLEMDARGMEDLAELGRLEARDRKARTGTAHTGVAIER
jgi:hypothetical protein